MGDLTDDQRDALRALIAGPIYELIPLSNARETARSLPSGASVTVTASPRFGIDATIALAEWLSAQGHSVAPHVAARSIRDRAQLEAIVGRLKNAGVRKAFIVGGDGAPTGEIRDGVALLRALEEIGHPFEEIGIPAYPEGHPTIPADVLVRDLRDKQPLAHAMTTQMSFNARAVTDWIARTRDDGITLPIHLGIPGAVGLAKLTAIAARIGVADSARYLFKHRGLFGHLAGRGAFTPDPFLLDLAGTLADPRANVRALHVFTMNDVASTLAWQEKLLRELGA